MQKDFISYITSSQKKIFSDDVILESITSGSALQNEPYSITFAYKTINTTHIPISVSARCDGIDVSVYKVGFVPVLQTEGIVRGVACEERGAGMYPDILYPRSAEPKVTKGDNSRLAYYEDGEKNLLSVTNEATQSLIITMNESGKTVKPGNYELYIEVRSLDTFELFAEHKFTLKVIGKQLPEHNLMYTNWFHYDCVADIHGVELYSEKYYEILKSYLTNAAKFRMNTLLLPAFTPPLDTFIGGSRKNVGLVKIKRDGKKYEFDFSELSRLISLASDCGIKYFEHAHFFTQWGAAHAPNIYAEENGELTRIFGWETDASGEEYKAFLNAYIPAFLSFAKNIGISDRLFFHISDEPNETNEETYGKAVAIVKDLISGYKSGDALGTLKFYENGFVKTPIVEIDYADKFFEKCDSMWLYYTGGYYPAPQELERCTNRLITSKPYCARILGLHLYKYKASGFLHWGYNYYYDRMSQGITDPKSDACGYKKIAGGAYIVYPGINEAIPSLREKYMCEAMDDYRALKALEEYIGYDTVIKLCSDFFGYEINCFTIPKSDSEMIAFREMINNEIEKYSEKGV